eukprot:20501-Heterococcus_DN1.PRE.6
MSVRTVSVTPSPSHVQSTMCPRYGSRNYLIERHITAHLTVYTVCAKKQQVYTDVFLKINQRQSPCSSMRCAVLA